MCDSASMLFAYLDPGTGSLVLQVLAGLIISAGFVFRRFFAWPGQVFAAIFRNRRSVSEQE